MKRIFQAAFFTVAALLAVNAEAQERDNIINAYGAPTYTGGDVPSPNQYGPYTTQSNTPDNTSISTAYPNPVRNTATILLQNEPVKMVSLIVINLNGNVLQTYRFNPGNKVLAIDVSTLPVGLYSFQVQEEGKTMQSVQLLKEDE